MADMTPERAQECLEAWGDSLDEVTFNDIRSAFRALADDILEYRIEHQHIENGVWHPITQWSPEWPLNDGHSVAPDERIVCRRASHPREVTDG